MDTRQQAPSIGRIVHYVLPEYAGGKKCRYPGDHRPAIIVKVWSDSPTPQTACQLQVFTDQTNDGLDPTVWATSVQQGEGPGTWHWPEYVPAQ